MRSLFSVIHADSWCVPPRLALEETVFGNRRKTVREEEVRRASSANAPCERARTEVRSGEPKHTDFQPNFEHLVTCV